MKRDRLDLYLNGTDGLRQLTTNMLLSWRTAPPHARRAWRSTVDLLWDLLPLVLAMIGPVLVVLAPVLALFTAHRELTDEEVRERRNRQRAAIHKNGGAA